MKFCCTQNDIREYLFVRVHITYHLQLFNVERMEVYKTGVYSGKVLSSYENNGALACITSYDSEHYHREKHYHENIHISYVLEGGCVETKKKEYEIIPGTITYYYAGEEHRVIKVARPTQRVNLEISNGFMQQFDIREDQNDKLITNNPDVPLFMATVFRELTEQDVHSTMAITEGILGILGPNNPFGAGSHIPHWVDTVKEYLRANISESISLTELGLVADVHPITISKKFPRYTHCSLSAFVRKLRIEKALTMIKDPDIPLVSIAYECGFFDQSHFIRTFKIMTGILPSDLRNR